MVQVRRHIGLDLGVKSKSRVSIVDQEGNKTGSQFSIETLNPADLEFMVKCAYKDTSEEVKVDLILEPTNSAWFPVVMYIKTHHPEISIYRVKSEKVQDLRKFYNKHTKTDSIDSFTLSKMPVVDKESLEEVYLPSRLILSLQNRVKQRDRIVKKISSMKNSICDQISLGFPGLIECFETPFTEPFIHFCEKYLNPWKIERLGKEGLKSTLKKLGFRVEIERLTEKIWQKALNTICFYSGEDATIDYQDFQEQVKLELTLFKSFQQELKKVEEKIEKFYIQAHPSRNIETIPGIGEHNGPVCVAFIGEPKRFSSAREFKGYTGYVPEKDESGNRNTKGLKMTKAGPNILKGALYLSFDKGRQYDPWMGKHYYDQMVYKGNVHTKAICSGVNKMAGAILTILKEDRPYVVKDLEGNPITKREGKRIVEEQFTVPEEIRARLRSKKRPSLIKKGKKENHFDLEAVVNSSINNSSSPEESL